MMTFDTLREANLARLPHFKNAKGEKAHTEADGSDWTPGEWICATAGELGELANIVKKLRRGDITLEEARPLIAKEAADTVTYLDIFCAQFAIDLGDATRGKFNEVSLRVGAPVYIEDGDYGDCDEVITRSTNIERTYCRFVSHHPEADPKEYFMFVGNSALNNGAVFATEKELDAYAIVRGWKIKRLQDID